MFYAAAAKSLQSCLTLCDPIDGSPPGSLIPGVLQARTLEWVAISFSHAWKWSCSVGSDSSWPHGLQPTRLLRPWDFLGKSTGVGCHSLLQGIFPTKGERVRRSGFLDLGLWSWAKGNSQPIWPCRGWASKINSLTSFSSSPLASRCCLATKSRPTL